MTEPLFITPSPHIRHIDTTRSIMADVIIALCPAAVFGCILFGWNALWILLCTTLTAVLTEFVWNKICHKPTTVGDFSAILTGLLLGMNLSPRVPIWIAAIGSVVAILVVKQMFGGLGHNFANPAIAARIVLLVSFPAQLSAFSEPVSYRGVDAISTATPLVTTGNAVPSVRELFFGLHAGCIGETSCFLLLLGGLYLIIRRVIQPTIPLAFIGTVAVLTLLTGGNLAQQVFGGGLILGAVFMATDYTTSPATPLGKLVFGIGCGLLTFVIRRFGSLPEGVSYSILLMNILTPHIDSLTASKPFGYQKEAGKHE